MATDTQQPLMEINSAIFEGAPISVSNVEKGAQLGLGAHLANIDDATPLAFPNSIIIVIHTPDMFDQIKNGDKAKVLLKTLVERFAKTIDGIDPSYTLETADGYTYPDGQNVSVPTKATRSQPSPSMTFSELTGNIVFRFFKAWQNLIIDPDTQFSRISQYLSNPDDIKKIKPHIFKDFCMDILVLQFDNTFLPQNLIDAAIVLNMFPTDIGSVGFKRDVTAGHEVKERSVSFTGIIQHNTATFELGKAVAEYLALHKALRYELAKPVANIRSKLANMLQDAAVTKEVQSIVNEFTEVNASSYGLASE